MSSYKKGGQGASAVIIKDTINTIIKNIQEVAESIDEKTIKELIEKLTSSASIFVIGLGRSGLVAKAFAMRLMHLGMKVFVVGETITPAIKTKDCLIAISGSGETSYILKAARIAKKRGSDVVAITSYPESSLSKIADLTVTIKGKTKIDGEQNYIKRQMKGNHHSKTPLGTLFEISALIFLDGLIAELMEKLNKKEKDMMEMHNVFE